MAPPLEAGADRAWRGLALSVTALAHAAALGGSLLDGDRLLLVRNPRLHSFSGLAAMLSEGRVLLRGAGLQVRDHAPLGAFSSWLSWEWFRAAPLVQHAIGPALLLALVASLFSLLRASKVSAPVAAVASLALSLHPCAADLSAPSPVATPSSPSRSRSSPPVAPSAPLPSRASPGAPRPPSSRASAPPATASSVCSRRASSAPARIAGSPSPRPRSRPSPRSPSPEASVPSSPAPPP
ncbi:MAG: hypothetical protein IPF99_28630 [Deltaproteobacteria bacterium]|nr:hypothetical protein [Deltaproteobacteria bacterium]